MQNIDSGPDLLSNMIIYEAVTHKYHGRFMKFKKELNLCL